MQVRIFFRGLILFRFPQSGKDAGKLVAELITEPPDRPANAKIPPGQDRHDAEIQVITGADVQQLLPHGLGRGARVEINIPGCTGGVRTAKSFDEHVPSIPTLATMARLSSSGIDDADYLGATIVVNCGTIRVKDVVIWDNGFPLPEANRGDSPSTPAAVKFCGVPASGHAANECVLETNGTDIVEIVCRDYPKLDGVFRSSRRRNQLAQENSVDILVRNYEYQREKPVPWGLDFQWLFARLGYGVANLGDAEVSAFKAGASAYDKTLFEQDEASMLPGTVGRPFPYLVSNASLLRLTPLTNDETKQPLSAFKGGKPTTDINSRPVCVPGRGG